MGPVENQTMVWSGTAWYDAVTGLTIKAGEWTHLAFTVNEGHMTVYVNGEEKFSKGGFPNVFTTTNGTFGLGVNWWEVKRKPNSLVVSWIFCFFLVQPHVNLMKYK